MPKAPDGYKALGRIFQAFPPVECTWPEELIAAIRSDIDPEVCPMWCANVYRSPAGGIHTIGRHWLWLEVRDRAVSVTVPRFIPASVGPNRGRFPNTILMALEKDRTEEQIEDNLSGDFIPMGWWLYDVMRAARNEYEPDVDKMLAASAERETAAKEADEKQVYGMIADRMDDEWGWMKHNIDKLTDKELELIGRYGLFGVPGQQTRKTIVDQGARS
jgi:hypothetical protein